MSVVKLPIERPKCQVPGCDKNAQLVTSLENPKFRKTSWCAEEHDCEGYVCATHHSKRIAENRGLPSMTHVLAQNAGFDSVTAYTNSMHPYLKYRKDYCENKDGRLGFKCTYVAPTEEQLVESGLRPDFMGWLQVDHIDGNHTNNKEENLQTLCANCHNIKTFQAGDYATPGRKTRKAD